MFDCCLNIKKGAQQLNYFVIRQSNRKIKFKVSDFDNAIKLNDYYHLVKLALKECKG